MTLANYEVAFMAAARSLFKEFDDAMGNPSWQAEADWSAKFQEWLKERENGN